MLKGEEPIPMKDMLFIYIYLCKTSKESQGAITLLEKSIEGNPLIQSSHIIGLWHLPAANKLYEMSIYGPKKGSEFRQFKATSTIDNLGILVIRPKK